MYVTLQAEPPTELYLAGSGAADAVMNGTLQSGNCGLHLDISLETVHVEVYLTKATSYAGMVMLLSCIQVCACRAFACLLCASCTWRQVPHLASD